MLLQVGITILFILKEKNGETEDKVSFKLYSTSALMSEYLEVKKTMKTKKWTEKREDELTLQRPHHDFALLN